MEQDKKSGTGAPSTDTTSALFVSQRKKQLEQQEADRRQREKEEQRQAAEAEVRRLEQEVEARKRNAEEEAKRVAEEARTKKAQAEADPDSVLGAPAQKEKKAIKFPSMPAGDGTAAAKPMDMKKIGIIGGAVAVVVLIIVIIAVAGGGGGEQAPAASGQMVEFTSDQGVFSLSYPETWEVGEVDGGVLLSCEDMGAFMGLVDITEDTQALVDEGTDIVTAVEDMLQGITEEMVGGAVGGLEPNLVKSGDFVTGNASFTYQDADLGQTDVDLNITTMNGRMIVDLLGRVDPDKAEAAYMDYRMIMDTLEVAAPAADAADTADTAEQSAEAFSLTAPAGYKTFDSSNGLSMICPEDWTISDTDGGMRRRVATITPSDDTMGFMLVANYADESTGLVGSAIYDMFLEDAAKAINMDISMAEDMQEVLPERNGTAEKYSQWIFFPNDVDIYFSIYMHNDEKNTVEGVVVAHRSNDEATLNKMDEIMASITPRP